MLKNFEATKEMPPYRFSKFSGEGTAETSSSPKDNIFGITDSQKTLKGDMAEVFMPGSIAEIQAGGTFSAGDSLTSDENGCAVEAGYGDNVGAIALQDAVKDDVVQVFVVINRAFEAPQTNKGDNTTSSTTPSGTDN